MADIRSINALRADRENDNRLLSPAESLQDALADIREGKCSPTKLLVIGLNTGPEGTGYALNFWMSNLKASETIALTEVFKVEMLKSLGYLPDG